MEKARNESSGRPRREMNIGQMKEAANANGGMSASSGSGGGGAPAGPTTTIPSLKRTLSGGATTSSGHTMGMGPPNLSSHLGVGMNSIPSVLHATPVTSPPQMLRAVTSSGVFNRPVSNLGNNTNNARMGASLSGSSIGGGAGGATTAVPTATRSVTQSSTMSDWRMYLTIEERQAVRSKIRDAYSSRCTTYEDLLQVACAIEEELLHIAAPSRLDYFKSGFEFENRVKLKKDQLQGQLAALDNKRRSSNNAPNPTGSSGNSPNTNESGSYNKKPRT
ncbi:hypothetical protein Poli38472_002856 [Pythium oligandrum]|uniref:Uncharacterized protein n=1 Tax=Pythium oligandrum TaxID=41045 RepID=A0A8K1C5G6_PYTOL|nr:hypothetical protein Poli38472_002856 [Pythium oligandrum]|eukprot:TMW56931.1 hypothetical protein Poli38472_002856 [Pythium oligandrum]